MNRTLLSALPAFVGALLCAPELVAQRNVIAGRDIQLQDTWALRGYVRSGTYPAGAFAVGAWTTCCNPGTNAIPFQAAMSPNHGYIHFIVARESNGRLEQISNWSFVKHTFGSSNDPSPCGNCAGPGSFSLVEVGCSDTYANSQAVNHFDLGPPSEIDPWLGTWDPQCSMFDAGNPAVAPAQACDNVRSLTSQQSSQLNAGLNNQMRLYDVDLQVQPANYFWQAGYLVPGEAESVRDNNLGSRGFTPTWNGTAWAFADIPNSFQQGTILQRWPGATITSATNGTSDGRFYVAVKVSGPINGKYHYEYAVHNRDNKRGMGAFRLPICPTAVVSNIGFHDVDRDPLNQWTANKVGGELVFSAPNNPLRWNSIFNFWFDCDAGPVTGSTLSLDQFDIGAGASSVLVTGTAPGTLYNEYIGGGCGTTVTPNLFAQGVPFRATLGNALFQMRSLGNPVGAPCAVAFSTQPGTTNVGGCTIYSGSVNGMNVIDLQTADISGAITQNLPIPNDPYLEGLNLDLQSVNLVSGGALLNSFNLSNGMRLRIGNSTSACP